MVFLFLNKKARFSCHVWSPEGKSFSFNGENQVPQVLSFTHGRFADSNALFWTTLAWSGTLFQRGARAFLGADSGAFLTDLRRCLVLFIQKCGSCHHSRDGKSRRELDSPWKWIEIFFQYIGYRTNMLYWSNILEKDLNQYTGWYSTHDINPL